ncbi:MAG: xanthine dehydrogenase family protein subunit M [Alphaproteobacteria bacterium]|nr:xanthine dehydrogenase family protein subunit M [Alphaproteobacteria bacterium]
MENFNYHRPATVAAAVAALKKSKDGKFLAGGHTLIPTMKQGLAAPKDVVDLTAIKGFSGIKVSKTAVTIKAGTTHQEVATSKEIKKAIPALAEMAGKIGGVHVRHRGTIGGSIANNDPAADYPSACMGLGATIETNKRKIEADKFFTGMFETALKKDEVITAVHFPIPKKASHQKFPNPASRYAMVGVFLSQNAKGQVRVGVTGAAPCVFRAKDIEAALAKEFSAKAAAGTKVAAKGLLSDMHASADYRAHLISVLAGRAVAAA